MWGLARLDSAVVAGGCFLHAVAYRLRPGQPPGTWRAMAVLGTLDLLPAVVPPGPPDIDFSLLEVFAAGTVVSAVVELAKTARARRSARGTPRPSPRPGRRTPGRRKPTTAHPRAAARSRRPRPAPDSEEEESPRERTAP